jgi:chromosome segregation ATPase
MKNLEKILLAVRIGLLVIGVIGLSSSGLQIWMLTELFYNAKEIEKVRAQLSGQISESEKALMEKISSSKEELANLMGALGNSPDRIQKAALKVENASETIAKFEESVRSIEKVEDDIREIKLNVEYIKDRLNAPRADQEKKKKQLPDE